MPIVELLHDVGGVYNRIVSCGVGSRTPCFRVYILRNNVMT